MAQRLASAFVELFSRDDKLQSGLQQVESRATAMINGIQATIAGLGAALGGGILGGGLLLAGELEQTTIAFETMLGSADKARKMLAEIRDFAATTPFELPGINQAARTLLAFGFDAEQIMPTLKTLGDVSAGTGKPLSELAVIFGQIKSAGRLMGQDLLQLIGAGFNPLEIIAEQTGESMVDLKKRMSQGKVSFDEVKGAFETATSEGGLFFDLMSKQSASFLGLVSTLKDNLKAVATTVGQAMLPAAKALTTAMIGLVGSINNVIAAIGPQATAAIVATTGAMLGLRAATLLTGLSVRQLVAVINKAVLASLWNPFVLTAVAISGVIAAIGALITWLSKLPEVQKAWKDSVGKLQVAWVNFKAAFAAIWEALRAVINSFIGFLNKTFGFSINNIKEGFIGAVTSMIQGFADFVLNLAEWFRVIVENWDTVTAMMGNGAYILWLRLRDGFFGVFKAIGMGAARMGQIVAAEFAVLWATIKKDFGLGTEAAVQAAERELAKAHQKLGRTFQDAFAPSEAQRDAIARQQRLMRSLMDAKRDLEGKRETILKDINRKTEELPDQIKQEVEAKMEKQAFSFELPEGFSGLTDLQRKMQEAVLKRDDPQKQLVDIGKQQRGLQEHMAKDLKELNQKMTGSPVPTASS